MKNKTLIKVLLLSVLFIGCNSLTGFNEKSGAGIDELNKGFFSYAKAVPMETLSKAVVTPHTGGLLYSKKENIIISDSEKFQSYWETLHQKMSLQPDLPQVDFETELVIVSVMGLKTVSGFSVIISDVAESDGIVGVKVQEVRPDISCLTTTELTNANHVVKIPRSYGEDVRFIPGFINNC